ncbi:MAG: hypothetical protein GY869_05120 [Planctomycetes bacterium]|nr:hypothetical protein [Planctomycetota bacterium]
MKILQNIVLSMIILTMGLAFISQSQISSAEAKVFDNNQQRRTTRIGSWTFERDEVGAVPRGWQVAETRGRGTPAQWQVKADPTAPSGSQVVAITENSNRGSTYNLLMAQRTSFQDLEISVMVKSDTGNEDQGGGPIWRAKDADNYYVARWNPLETNLRFYYVKEGRRIQLATAENVEANTSLWHEIKIVHIGTKVTAAFDGEVLIEAEDATFAEAGMVGLWTKADAATAFDSYSIKSK